MTIKSEKVVDGDGSTRIVYFLYYVTNEKLDNLHSKHLFYTE
jgi:hypothetical protein